VARIRTINVQYPRGGLSKRFAYQSQPPFTTVDSANTRPEATLEKRLRGGSRPGLLKSFGTQISGASNPIRLLTVMRSLNVEGRATFSDSFSNMDNWQAASWTDGIPTASGGKAIGTASAIASNGAELKSGSVFAINEDSGYSIAILVDEFLFTKYTIYAGMADADPANTNSLSATVQFGFAQLTSLSGRSTFTVRQDDVELAVQERRIAVPGATAPVQKWFKLVVRPGVLAAYYDDMTVPVVTATATLTPAGDAIGFVVESIVASTTPPAIADIVCEYINATGLGVPPEAVVASAGGEIWRETTDGNLVEIGNYNGLSLASDRPLQAVDYLGKLYIADSSETRISRTDDSGVIVAGELDADIGGWDTYGIVVENDVVEITDVVNGSGELDDGADDDITSFVFVVESIDADDGLSLKVLNGTSLDGDDACDSCNFRVTRGAKVYDSDADALTHWKATAGLVPAGCPIIEIFQERPVLGGDPESPGVWFMGRFADFLDFNYGASNTDRLRAAASNNTNSDTGGLAIPMSAIAACTEDYLLFSAESELFLLRGDPTIGGVLGNVSRQIGIGSRTAWCRLPDGSVAFLSRDGLYRFHPSNPIPENLSREKLPAELIDVVQNTNLTVSLEFDVAYQGIDIFITPATAGPTTHYWFDWATRGLWKVALASTDHDPLSITYDAKANRVLLGGRDGYLRHYDPAASDDDGTTVSSHVLYGPFRLGGAGEREGQINEVYVVLDDASGDVTLDVLVGDDPESASVAPSSVSRTLSSGYSGRVLIRARGAWGFIRVSDSSGSQWAIDSLSMTVKQNGRHRK